MLQVTNLSKQYNNSNIYALDNISFHTGDTGLIFVVGESGSGKTTLLNILGSLDKGSTGNVYFYDDDIQNYTNKEKENYRNNKIGFIFQEHNLFSHLNVRGNILMSEAIQNKKPDLIRYEEVINLLELQGLDKRYPHELSTGQKQRVAIARALVKNSQLILADEPTGSLDYENAVNVMGYLKEISKNTLVIVVSHNKEFASMYADRIIELDKGKIVSDKIISTNNEIIDNIKNESLMNKNKLSYKTILKYIVSNIKTRIFSTSLIITLISLVITILAVLTFIVKYDNIQFLLKNMEKTNDNIISIVYHKFNESDENCIISSGHKKENLTELSEKFPNYTFFPVYKSNDIYLKYVDSKENVNWYENNGIIELSEDKLETLDFELIAGKIPEKNDDFIEIAITKYIYQKFKSKYIDFSEGELFVDSYQSILDKTFYRNNKIYKIVGIIDTKFNHEKAIFHNSEDLIEEFEVHNAFFTYNGYYNEVLSGNEIDMFKVLNGSKDYHTISTDVNSISINFIKKIPKENVVFKDGYSYETLIKDDIVLTSKQFQDLFLEDVNISSLIYDEVMKFAEANYSLIKDDFEKDHGLSHYSRYYYYIIDNKDDNKYQPGYNYDYFVKTVVSKILLDKDKFEIELSVHKSTFIFEKKLNIVGIIYDDYDDADFYKKHLYVTEDLYNELYEYNDGEIAYVITKLDFKKDNTELMKSIFLFDGNYVFYNGIREPIEIVDENFNALVKLYKYCWLVLIGFTLIILYYISKSIIKIEKQKIGLLIALGVKKLDIMKILILEFIFILLLSLPISLISTSIFTTVINNHIKTKYLVMANAINYNPFIIVLISLVVILISILIYLKSIFKYARISPISIIKDNA